MSQNLEQELRSLFNLELETQNNKGKGRLLGGGFRVPGHVFTFYELGTTVCTVHAVYATCLSRRAGDTHNDCSVGGLVEVLPIRVAVR